MATLEEIYKNHEDKSESSFMKVANQFFDITGELNTEDFGFKDIFIDMSKDKIKVDGKKMTIGEFNDTYKNASGMNYFDALKASANAQTDDDVMDVIHKLSEPSGMDRKTAQDTYNEYLGYDPTIYWDEKEIDEKLTQFEVAEGNPRSLVESHEDIVKSAVTYYESNRDYSQSLAIKQAMTERGIDEDLLSSFDRILQSLAIDDDDYDDFEFETIDESEEEEDDEESSIFDDDDSEEDD